MSEQVSTAALPDREHAGIPYMVGRDHEGHWIACDKAGRHGGWFVSQQAAMDYARFETNWQPGAVELAAKPLSLQFR